MEGTNAQDELHGADVRSVRELSCLLKGHKRQEQAPDLVVAFRELYRPQYATLKALDGNTVLTYAIAIRRYAKHLSVLTQNMGNASRTFESDRWISRRLWTGLSGLPRFAAGALRYIPDLRRNVLGMAIGSSRILAIAMELAGRRLLRVGHQRHSFRSIAGFRRGSRVSIKYAEHSAVRQPHANAVGVIFSSMLIFTFARMCRVVAQFVFHYSLLLLGFSSSFHLLLHGLGPHTDLLSSMRVVFLVAFGELNYSQNFHSANVLNARNLVGFVLLVLYDVVVTIVALNLMTALMTSEYEKVRSQAEERALMELAGALHRYEKWLGRGVVKQLCESPRGVTLLQNCVRRILAQSSLVEGPTQGNGSDRRKFNLEGV
ncbi:hypothetical protein FI667_g1468, partial [Globisporangium splendens]